jgi:branched-chain amino acid transport system substrate-binding protein
MVRKPLVFLGILALFAIFVASCGGTKEEVGGGATAAPGDTTGITDTSIKVGALLPLSGVAADYGAAMEAGMTAYFDWINDQGGVYGRQIELVSSDTQYTGPGGTEAAVYLINQQHVFAFAGTIGTQVATATKQMLDEQGIPDMFLLSGVREFSDPPQPNRFVSQLSYYTEGKAFGQYFDQNYAGKKIGILAQNDDFGKEGEQGIKDELAALNSDVETTTQYYDSTASDSTAQLQRLKTENVDAVMFFGTALPGASMIKTIRETLSWDVQILMNEGSAPQAIGRLCGYNNLVGIITTSITEATVLDETEKTKQSEELFHKYQPDAPQTYWDGMGAAGWLTAETFTGILKLTGPDLTRESFLAAAEKVCKYKSDIYSVPESTSPTDHAFIEALVFTKGAVNDAYVEGTDDPNDQVVFFPFGDLVAFESTPDCEPVKMPEGAKDQPGVDLGVY